MKGRRRKNIILNSPSYMDKRTGQTEICHKDFVERFDNFRRRKSRRNDDFRGRFYGVTELAFFGAEN